MRSAIGARRRLFSGQDDSIGPLAGAAAAAETHVFALAGQSNMCGRAPWDSGAQPDTAKVKQIARTGSISGGTDGQVVAWNKPLDHVDAQAGKMGLDTTFAIDYLVANPSCATLILVPCAQGATSFSAGAWGVGNALSEALISRVNTYLAANPTALLKGLLWHQGESSSAISGTYRTSLEAQFAEFRSRLTGGTNMPIIVGELGTFVTVQSTSWNTISNILKNTPNRVARTACVVTESLTDIGDATHFDAPSLRIIGSRYAAAVAVAAANTSPAAGAPSKVDNLSVTEGTSGQLVCAWQAAADHESVITGYTLEWSLKGANSWTQIALGNVLTGTITGLTNGTSYDVRVKATNAIGTGPYSNVLTFAPSSGSLQVGVTDFARNGSATSGTSFSVTLTTSGGDVIVAIASRAAVNGSPTPNCTALTIGGVSATLINSFPNNTGSSLEYFKASGVPSGSITLSWTLANTAARSGAAVWSLTNANMENVRWKYAIGTTAITTSITMQLGSAVLGTFSAAAGATIAWTGLTERSAFAEFVAANGYGAEYADYISAAGETRAISATATGTRPGTSLIYVPAR